MLRLRQKGTAQEIVRSARSVRARFLCALRQPHPDHQLHEHDFRLQVADRKKIKGEMHKLLKIGRECPLCSLILGRAQMCQIHPSLLFISRENHEGR